MVNLLKCRLSEDRLEKPRYRYTFLDEISNQPPSGGGEKKIANASARNLTERLTTLSNDSSHVQSYLN